MATWNADQLRRFLEHVQGDRLHAAYRLVASTGLRRGEALGVRWKDVDLARSRLAVTQTLTHVSGELRFGPPKTAKGRRLVPLDPATVEALTEHKLAQEEERRALGIDGEPELVFTEPGGSPVSPPAFTDAFRSRAKVAGLPRIRLHDLRHTWATLALQSGVHPKVVSEILGHSSVAITLDRYSHSVPTLNETAVSVVASLFTASEDAPVPSPDPADSPTARSPPPVPRVKRGAGEGSQPPGP